ncbi:membrane protein insertion efficiency factor YidD [Cellulomonas sp. C5510]|uniref:membrane protein insertion efficiency factor YidD n=1 Tax=Cellulomonas sp. C5510 TaxID=2871170 RepID=UPI001C968A69|nr:membrane protein insertion efficiency factor YidD [Cellulomonas sp. C5510]QZN85672.1 membrane protein insertion efficiency factor YidD [Cellulomonas sp. C5510]
MTAPAAPTRRRLARGLRAVVRAPRGLLVLLIRGYQRFLSPLTPPTCRFYPSCSAYAVIALERHGVLKGTRLAVWRILRCNPWNPGGVDDVPPAGSHRRHPHGAVASAH